MSGGFHMCNPHSREAQCVPTRSKWNRQSPATPVHSVEKVQGADGSVCMRAEEAAGGGAAEAPRSKGALREGPTTKSTCMKREG